MVSAVRPDQEGTTVALEQLAHGRAELPTKVFIIQEGS